MLDEQTVFAWLQRKYTQDADARQKSMGLVYMTAETHDLAREITRMANTALAAAPRKDDELEVTTGDLAAIRRFNLELAGEETDAPRAALPEEAK